MNKKKLKNLLALVGEELWRFLRPGLILYGLLFIGFYVGLDLFVEKTGAREVSPARDYQVSNRINPGVDALLTDIDFNPQYQRPGSSEVAGIHSDSENKHQYELHIPILTLRAPIIVMHSTDPEDYKEVLKKGVALFPSALPGEKGRTIILGHSAPPGWPKINYDHIFNDLNDLKKGDNIIITFGDEEYIFEVKTSRILNKGQDLPPFSDSNLSSELVLITCWPPGVDHQRLVIFAERK